jgi:hypothetical protein
MRSFFLMDVDGTFWVVAQFDGLATRYLFGSGFWSDGLEIIFVKTFALFGFFFDPIRIFPVVLGRQFG